MPALLWYAVAEDGVHEWVEAGGGLVEQQQFGARREGRHQRDHLAVALGVGSRFLARIELEPLDQFRPAPGVEASPQPAQQVDHFAARETKPEDHLVGNIGDAAMQTRGIPPVIAAQ